jgi:hypothetical protein
MHTIRNFIQHQVDTASLLTDVVIASFMSGLFSLFSQYLNFKFKKPESDAHVNIERKKVEGEFSANITEAWSALYNEMKFQNEVLTNQNKLLISQWEECKKREALITLENKNLRRENIALRSKIVELEARIAALERKV